MHHSHHHLHTEINDTEESGKGSSAARRASLTGFWVNVSLGVAKILAGAFGRSSALVADGIHTFADTFSDIMIFFFVPMSRKDPDRRFSYGRGKIETLTSLIISIVLIVVGIGILSESIEAISEAFHGHTPDKPGWIALVIVTISIILKEGMFRYFRSVGRKISSQAMIANAWHHRTDALSSAATLIGIAGAMFLGENFRILDPIAAIIVGVMIIVAGIRLTLPAVAQLLDMSLSKDEVARIDASLKSLPQVEAVRSLRTRCVGHKKVVDATLCVSPSLSLNEGERIIAEAEKGIREIIGTQSQITITLRTP